MSGAVWVQFLVLIALVAVATPLLGGYMCKVFSPETLGAPRGERVFGAVERVVYRLTGVNPDREQRWTVYARSLLAFSVVSVLTVYLIQRIQGLLPANPTDVGAAPEPLAFNTAVSFVTNTNWQNYAGEITMSHLTQMTALAVQNFVSAAVGMAVAVALVRGLVRRRSTTIGNFWVDLRDRPPTTTSWLTTEASAGWRRHRPTDPEPDCLAWNARSTGLGPAVGTRGGSGTLRRALRHRGHAGHYPHHNRPRGHPR